MGNRRTFVVGRKTGRLVTLVVLCAAQSPIVGPWVVRAVVSAN
jgi:hypothetical protein